MHFQIPINAHLRSHRCIFFPILIILFSAVTTCLAQFVGCDTVSIMPLGNSITEPETGHASYRCWLWDSLRLAHIATNFVGSRHGVLDDVGSGSQTESTCPCEAFDEDHEGHYGWTVDQVLYGDNCWYCYAGRLGKWIVKNTVPDIVLLHLGINDIAREKQKTDSIIQELSFMVDTLRSYNPAVTILLAQIIPTKDTTINAAVEDFNAAIPSFADSIGSTNSPVLVVDQASGYVAETDNFDTYHPNEQGEKKGV